MIPQPTLNLFRGILLTSEADLAQRVNKEDLVGFIQRGIGVADRWYAVLRLPTSLLRDIIVVAGPSGRSRAFLGDHNDLVPGEQAAVESAWAEAASALSVSGPIVLGLQYAVGKLPPPQSLPQPWIDPPKAWVTAAQAFGAECTLDEVANYLLAEK